RFHLRTTEELTSNSRARPESVISPRRTRSICSFLKAVVNSRRPSAPLRNSPILLLLEEVQHYLSQVSSPIGGRRIQPRAKEALREIMNAESRKTAEKGIADFAEEYGAKYPKALESLTRDQDKLLSFFDFPAEHWKHLRTTNPIESAFATVRL